MSEDQGSLPPFALPETGELVGYRVANKLEGYFFSCIENMPYWRDLHGLVVEPVYLAPSSQQASKGGSELKSDILKGAEG